MYVENEQRKTENGKLKKIVKQNIVHTMKYEESLYIEFVYLTPLIFINLILINFHNICINLCLIFFCSILFKNIWFHYSYQYSKLVNIN